MMKQRLEKAKKELEKITDPYFAMSILNIYEKFYMDGYQDGYYDGLEDAKNMEEAKKWPFKEKE